MKTFFDSSVLVAVCVQHHPKNEAGKNWLDKAKNNSIKAYIASHSLIESYSVLTRAPFKPKIGSQMAKALLDKNVLPYVELVSINSNKYNKIFQNLAFKNISGGQCYDAIILECAIQTQANQIITANPKDFTLLKNALGYEIDVIGI